MMAMWRDLLPVDEVDACGEVDVDTWQPGMCFRQTPLPALQGLLLILPAFLIEPCCILFITVHLGHRACIQGHILSMTILLLLNSVP